MRQIKILIVLIFLTGHLFAQTQVAITLITDSGVKMAEYLKFSLANSTSTTHNFKFHKFSKDGLYPNKNLFQLSEDIDIGLYEMNILFKTDKEQNITDSLLIDSATSRIELFVFLSTTDSTGDYIKEIKTLKYKANSNYVKFSLLGKPRVGSDARFIVENIGDTEIYGYPNNAFFFGTLYQQIGADSWTQHYPRYIDIKYCDTVSEARPLAVGRNTIAWTPNDKDCSKYRYIMKGNYYFELLYSTTNNLKANFQGYTRMSKIDIFRQIFEFKL